jgi:hypothetical protein
MLVYSHTPGVGGMTPVDMLMNCYSVSTLLA